MNIGIVTDVHEDVENLARVLEALRGVDVLVSLGDTCDLYGPASRAAGVAALLRDAGAVGVWGNHDIGLCHDVPARVRATADPALLAYMATMRPRLEIDGCHFSHVEPWLDPHDPAQIWYFDGPPETPAQVRRSLDAIPHRAAFVGHFHLWRACTAGGVLPWDGTRPLALDPAERYLIVVAPVFAGAFAVLDTAAGVLTPRRVGRPGDGS